MNINVSELPIRLGQSQKSVPKELWKEAEA